MARIQQKERSEAVRNLILNAAQDIANESGLERLTVRNIGDRIGYSTGVIYYHFENKQDIIDALRARRDEDAYNYVITLVREDSSFRDNFSRVIKYIALLAHDKKESYYRLFASRRRPGEQYAYEIWFKLCCEIVRISVQKGEIGECDIEMKANCILGFFLGFDILFLELCPKSREETMIIADNIVDIVVNGLK